MKILRYASTKLEREVQAIINRNARGYGDSAVPQFLRDLAQHGCESGIVSEMIYYRDTLPFYRRHREEINQLLSEQLSECGERSPAVLFKDKWDDADPLALDTQNQNLLAWYAVEEIARVLAERNGIEI